MKQKKIIPEIFLVLLLMTALTFVFCQSNNHASHSTSDQKQTIYYCPMHPSYTSDKPGNCPICGMTLVPRIEEDKEMKEMDMPQGTEHKSHTSVTIPLDRQQLIGVKTDTVKKAPAILTIKTAATSALNPELATAEREYLEAKKLNDRSLLKAAKNRLTMLGLNETSIKKLTKVETALYLPSKDGWAYPVVYENELRYFKPGQNVTLTFSDNKTIQGVVESIDNMIDPRTRTARLHVKLEHNTETLIPNLLANAEIQIDLGEQLLVPKSAVIRTGTRDLVFVVHDKTHFSPTEIQIVDELEAAYTIKNGLNENDIVVASATFLIDSESQMRSAVENLGGQSHQH